MSEQFRVSVSFEHDTKPVLTVREDFSSEDFESAFKTGLFRAFKKLPGRFNVRSVVCVVEKLGIVELRVALDAEFRGEQEPRS